MIKNINIVVLFSICAIGCSSAEATDKTDTWRASINALGPAQIGMTSDTLEDYTGELERQHGDGEGCIYFSPVNGEKDVSFMLYEGRLVRIDVYSRKTETLSGVRVGDTRDNIMRMYDHAVEEIEEDDSHGQMLYLKSNRPEYRNYRMVFDVKNNIVSDYRLGLLPYVNWQQGCSGER